MTSEKHISWCQQGLAAASALALAPMHTFAESAWHEKPVKLVVPVTVGSGTDILARTVGEHLGRSPEQNFVIDNRSGADGILRTQQIFRSTPDGYTLGVIPSSAIMMNPAIYKDAVVRDARPHKEAA